MPGSMDPEDEVRISISGLILHRILINHCKFLTQNLLECTNQLFKGFATLCVNILFGNFVPQISVSDTYDISQDDTCGQVIFGSQRCNLGKPSPEKNVIL